jgi:hypothetical protein
MDIYSEHGTGDRRATVTLVRQSEWVREMDYWEVAMYVQGKPIQRQRCFSQHDAETLAEDFCVCTSGPTGPTLLNEDKRG